MSLAQIEYFVAVAHEGRVARAARALRVAQPAVSRQIKQLEDELGAALFVRTPAGMQLTAAGEAFLDHAHDVLRTIASARRAVLSDRATAPRHERTAMLARRRHAAISDGVLRANARLARRSPKNPRT
jgi:DNA-binding transcriptional LysR family regulator